MAMSLSKRGILSCMIFLSCCANLGAADKTPSPKEKATAVVSTAPKEILIMSVHVGQHWLLSRMLPDGSCKQFLSQSEGFLNTVPTKNQGDDFDPATTADGKHFAFYSNRDGAVNLWISDSSGRSQHPVTSDDTSIAALGELPDAPIQFSPDSKKLVYLYHGDLWVCSLASEEIISISSGGGVEAFAFSPDGKWLAYYRKGSLRRVSLSGQPDELLAANAANWPTLTYGSDPKKNDLYYFYKGVWSIDTSTKEKTFLVGSLKYPNKLRINPQSGDSISFVGLSPDLRPEAYLLFPKKKGGGRGRFETTLLTQGGASSPFFSSNGKTIYFQRDNGLWSISATGDKVKQLQVLACLMPNLGFLDIQSSPECAKP